MPRRLDDKAMTISADSTPLHADWTMWLVETSSLVAQCFDAMSMEDHEEDLYRKVLDFDSRIRAHRLPAPLQSRSEENWVRWARQEATLCKANKIMLIHRRFLSKAVVDERFAYSQWAAVDASRTVVRELQAIWAEHKRRPKFWNDQVSSTLIIFGILN